MVKKPVPFFAYQKCTFKEKLVKNAGLTYIWLWAFSFITYTKHELKVQNVYFKKAAKDKPALLVREIGHQKIWEHFLTLSKRFLCVNFLPKRWALLEIGKPQKNVGWIQIWAL